MPCEKGREKSFSKISPEKSENVLFGNLDQIERRGKLFGKEGAADAERNH